MLDLKPNKKLALNAIDYLEKAAQILLTDFIQPVADKTTFRSPLLQVTVSFAHNSPKAIGQCFPTNMSNSKKHNLIAIHPRFGASDTSDVLQILHHELIHASDGPQGNQSGHKKYFRATAIASGLTGKMTATTATPETNKKYEKLIISKLGGFPFEGVETGARIKKKQGTRNVKMECNSCEFSYRTSRKNIDLIECFSCPCCGGLMSED